MARTRFKFTPILPTGAQVDVAAFRRDATSMVRSVTAEGTRDISRYPPQRLRKSGYRRTGTLKRSWSSRVRSTTTRIEGTVGSNSNIAPYNRLVQGPRRGGKGRRQLALFRGAGWRGVDELKENMEDRMQRELQEIVDRLAR